MNMTLLEKDRCTTCYLVNHSLSTAIDFKTFIEVWSNNLTEYSLLKVFECLTYYQVSEGKLNPKAKKGFFTDYGDEGQRILSLVSILKKGHSK